MAIFIMPKFFFLIFASFIIFGCTKNEPKPITFYWRYSNNSTLTGVITTLPSQSFSKPNIAGFTIPTVGGVASSVVYRYGYYNYPGVGSISGSLLNKVPNSFINTLTLGNVSLSSIAGTNQVFGWLVQNVKALYSNGSVADVTNQMPASSKADSAIYQSLSIMISFYPDGYYTIINTYNQSLNHWGWYQIAMNDTIPVAVIYNQFGSGKSFNNPPLNLGNTSVYPPNQGFGIWGLQKDAFYPLFALDRSTNVFLKTIPVQYQIQ
jgi:hypothetical protein